MFRTISFGMLWLAAPLAAQQVQVTQESMHAVSSPLRNLSDNLDNFDVQDQENDEEVQGPAPVDPVVQTAATIPLATTPLTNMLGLGTRFTGPHGSRPPGGAPPDANAAVGTSQIVETVNLALAVFDKATGTAVLGPLFMGALWRALDPECSNGANLADPMVLFDKQAQRWIMGIHTLSTPYSACLAVSQTSDATGAYNLYAFPMQSDGRLTELRIGTWPGGYYLATSISNNSVYEGQATCAVDRAKMLAGQAATMQCVRITDTRVRGMAPANMDGSIAPPAGSPDYYIAQGPAGSNSLYLYRFHADFVNPEKSSFGGPIEIKVAPYTANNLVPQYGTTQLLHSNGTGMMTPLQYRNFANAAHPYESLVVNHTVQTGTVSNHGAGIRWYELRSPGSTPLVYQQGTYART